MLFPNLFIRIFFILKHLQLKEIKLMIRRQQQNIPSSDGTTQHKFAESRSVIVVFALDSSCKSEHLLIYIRLLEILSYTVNAHTTPELLD